MTKIPRSHIPPGITSRPTGEPSAISRKWGRFVVWLKTVGRSDDKKIEAIMNRLFLLQDEYEWALEELFKLRKKLQNQANPEEKHKVALGRTELSIEEVTRSWKRTLTPSLLPAKAISPAFQKAYAEGISDRILYEMKKPKAPEEDLIKFVLYEVDQIQRLPEDARKTILKEVLSRILPEVSPDHLILQTLVTGAKNNDPSSLYSAFSIYATKVFDDLVSMPEGERSEAIKKRLKEFTLICAAARTLFPNTNVAECVKTSMSSGMKEALAEKIDTVSIRLLLEPNRFSPEKLTECLSEFISLQENETTLQELSTSFGIQEEIPTAYRKMVDRAKTSHEFDSIVKAIVTYTRRTGEFDFQALKECIAVLAKCPDTIQVPLLAALRESLKGPQKRLPKEVDPLDRSNRLLEIPELARNVFEYPWIRALDDLGKIRPS
jgi:hypothetical protein